MKTPFWLMSLCVIRIFFVYRTMKMELFHITARAKVNSGRVKKVSNRKFYGPSGLNVTPYRSKLMQSCAAHKF